MDILPCPRARLRPSPARSGFTLIELIITLAVSITLLAVAVPSYQSFAANNRLRGAVNLMAATLQLTRSEAVTSGQRSVLCASRTGVDCDSTFDEWEQGLLIFRDLNGNRRRDHDEPVVRHHRPSGDLVKLLTTSGRRTLSFRPDGTSPGSNVTFTFCDAHGQAEPRALILSNSGRPRLSYAGPGGRALVCP